MTSFISRYGSKVGIFSILVIPLVFLGACILPSGDTPPAAATLAAPTHTIPPTTPVPPSPSLTATPAPPITPLPPLAEGPVTFATEDGLTLSGVIFGKGPTAVILAHMMPTTQSSWKAFAELAAEKGFTVLTFNFRGYGESGGKKDYGLLDKDVRAAIALLRNHGIQRIVCIGASMGGTACGKATHEPGMAGLVIISSPDVVEPPLQLASADFADLTYPKLFIGSKDDQPYTRNIQAMFDWSPEPKQIKIFSGSDHGTYLFYGNHAAEFQDILLSFLANTQSE